MTFAWQSLLPEIRNIILKQLARDDTTAIYASVCKEWRNFFGKRNFSHLKIPPSDLDFVDQLSQGSTRQVDHIWLNIELKRYTCRICRRIESPTRSYLNDRIIVEAVVKLFSVLARWDHNQHLTLELNAYSPSDSEHWFKTCYFGAPGEEKFDITPKSKDFHDPQHGWEDGRVVKPPADRALARPFAIPYGAGFGTDEPRLPIVRAVTKFVLRRQCRRQIDPLMLSQLWCRLPRLEEISFEPWQSFYGGLQEICDQFYEEMIYWGILKNVKKVTIFEDFNENYLDVFWDFPDPDDSWDNPARVRTTSFKVGDAFVRRSRGLEHLSVGFLTDAYHFFKACQPDWQWDQLQSLCLTSRLMSKTTPNQTNQLLTLAAQTIPRMPKLETLTLWNGARGEACSFTYRREYGSIIWRGTWDLRLRKSTLDAWQSMSGVETYLIQDVVRSHGDAIKCLGLDSVIDAVSLKQIVAENSQGFF